MPMVQMKALLFLTVAGTRGILHTDPSEKADIRARFPLVSEPDAAILERHKAAERYEGKVPEAGETGDGTTAEGLSVDERAGVMVQDTADADQSTNAATGLDTRQTTAFPEGPDQLRNVTGDQPAVGVTVVDDGADADAPPATGGRRGRKPAAASE